MRFKKSTTSVIIILVALATIIGLSGLNFLIPNIKEVKTPQAIENMEKIFLTTKDGIKIATNFYPAQNAIGWLVLVHMMPSTKESWDNLAKDFQNAGYESIAIDLRGHGESAEDLNSYKNFSDTQHQKSILDLEAAVDYLIKERKATPEKISFVGASIGANLSLQYVSQNQEFKTAVLLSVGLNYHGIKTEPLVKNLKTGQKIFFVSSRDDDNNTEENQKLSDSTPAGVEKQIEIYDSGGHGTDILENQSELKNLIIDFIK